ncbi:MAG TPA: MFS transporter [Burkholderiales bacterium]|nr:MFS transporter [Burkholderiales bacterium]
MRPDSPPRAEPPPFVVLLTVLMLGQALGTMATSILPTVAPKVVESYRISSALIGYQVSLISLAMLVSLVFGGNLSVRWGGCRVSQLGLALCIIGCIVAVLPHQGFMLLSALPMGLGYGLVSPATSQVLMRFTPPARRNFIFSLKQTGVPLGGIAAAGIAPGVAVWAGWQWALIGNAAALAILMLIMQRHRAYWDDDRDPNAPLTADPFRGLAIVWRDRALRLLGIAGGAFVIMQLALLTFTVIFFVEEMTLGLVQAGIILMASQVGGVAGRLFWGWVADAFRDCFKALALLGAVMSVTTLLCITITPAWPLVASCALFFVLGTTASGWNGAFLAEVARLAPKGSVSTATGGSLFLVNIGKFIGPILFTLAYQMSGSYASAFALMALPSALGLWCVLRARKPQPAAIG